MKTFHHKNRNEPGSTVQYCINIFYAHDVFWVVRAIRHPKEKRYAPHAGVHEPDDAVLTLDLTTIHRESNFRVSFLLFQLLRPVPPTFCLFGLHKLRKLLWHGPTAFAPEAAHANFVILPCKRPVRYGCHLSVTDNFCNLKSFF